MSADRHTHWEQVYTTRRPDEVSWHQREPGPSLSRLEAAGLGPGSRVIDVGGGDSRLVDRLLALGAGAVTVLDISESAIERARHRLGPAARHVTWICADVVSDDWTAPEVDFWHDRALFHFLVTPADRRRYVERLRRTLRPGGHAVIATFAADGPTRCSGLPVERYSAETLATALGPEMRLVSSDVEDHHTPTGALQRFQWCTFKRLPSHD